MMTHSCPGGVTEQTHELLTEKHQSDGKLKIYETTFKNPDLSGV